MGTVMATTTAMVTHIIELDAPQPVSEKASDQRGSLFVPSSRACLLLQRGQFAQIPYPCEYRQHRRVRLRRLCGWHWDCIAACE
jgi:hypothetical protein